MPPSRIRPTRGVELGAPALPGVLAGRLVAGDGGRADGGRRAVARRQRGELLGGAARRRDRRRAQRRHPAGARRAAPAAHARARLPARAGRGRADPAHRGRHHRRRSHRRQLRLGAAGRAGRGRGERRARRLPRLRRHLLDPRREAHRPPPGRDRQHAGPGDHLPGDRRAGAAGAAARDARRQRPEHGRVGWPRARTAWPSGRPICPRRPAPARPGSCSAPTTTSPRSAGSRRRPPR